MAYNIKAAEPIVINGRSVAKGEVFAVVGLDWRLQALHANKKIEILQDQKKQKNDASRI